MAEMTYYPDPRETPLQWLLSREFFEGGGGGDPEVYEGRDPAPPDDPTKAAINYPVGGGPQTQWNVASQAWV